MRTHKELRAILAERWPSVFRPQGSAERKCALARGIHHQIRASDKRGDLTNGEIGVAIRDYVRGPKYLRAVACDVYRYNIDGTVSGVIDTKSRQKAKEEMTKWYPQHSEAFSLGSGCSAFSTSETSSTPADSIDG